MPGTWRSVHASWSTARSSSLTRDLQDLPRQRHLGHAALGHHDGEVEVGARRQGRPSDLGERTTRAGEQAADQVRGGLLPARDEDRVRQQRPPGLVVEVEVEPREAAVEERRRHHAARSAGCRSATGRPRRPAGCRGSPSGPASRRASRRGRRGGGCRPGARSRRRLVGCTVEGVVDDRAAVGLPGASRPLGEERPRDRRAQRVGLHRDHEAGDDRGRAAVLRPARAG